MRTALALSPNDPRVLDLGADTYEKLGDRKKAVELLVKAIRAGYTKEQLIADPELQDALSDPAVKALLK